jgi:hypothetical protein
MACIILKGIINMVTVPLKTSLRVPPQDCCDVDYLQMMINRCIVGYYRYGSFRRVGRTIASDRLPLDRLEECLRKYKKTGNRELLVDIGNYAMSEFAAPHHPKAHLKCEDQGVR